ncbi:MAG TPA: pYEATS domain-containing protein [Chitinophagaceae bacterium]|nr:pYEATS domain-containing protein [Chitinophagaceae bacterium]
MAERTSIDTSMLDDRDPNVWKILKLLILLGFIAIVVLSIGSVLEQNKNGGGYNIWKSGGTALLISGACFSAGALMGFLFAIPKLLQNTNLLPDQIKNDQTVILHNDNLVQISDWLTKIIVGVGLTQLNDIPDFLKRIGDRLGKSFGDGAAGSNIAIGCILYFVVIGFLSSYIWTRLYFVKLLRQTNDDLQKRQIEKLAKLADIAVEDKNKKTITESDVASDAAAIDTLKATSSDEIKSELDKLKEKVKEVLKSKTVKVKDDLQKNRWGGKAENNGKQIKAAVSQSKLDGFYDIFITVTGDTPLTTPVAIFVHDSFAFPDDVVYVVPDAKGVAQITLTAYEAFTIGAFFADGTELELDLNQQAGYPRGFYWFNNSNTSSAV